MTKERQETINDIANVADNRAIRRCAILEYDEKLAEGHDDRKAYGFAMGLVKIMNHNNSITEDDENDGYDYDEHEAYLDKNYDECRGY